MRRLFGPSGISAAHDGDMDANKAAVSRRRGCLVHVFLSMLHWFVGNVAVTIIVRPSSLEAEMRPLCASTMALAMDRPMP